MPDSLTPEERSTLDGVVAEFNAFMNKQIRAGTLQVYTMMDLIGGMYLRLRMQLMREDAVPLIEKIVDTVEAQIDAKNIVVQFADGSGSFTYLSAEDLAADPAKRDILLDATRTIEDDELNKFLEENL